MRRVAAGLSLILLLSGCSGTPAFPPDPDAAETRMIIERGNLAWWHQMFPDEDPPIVTAGELLSADEWEEAITDCVANTTVELMSQVRLDEVSDEQMDAVMRASWLCQMEFPSPVGDPSGYWSNAQLEWLYGFYVDRLVPCIRSIGYRVNNVPKREVFLEQSIGGPVWNPYYDLEPMPNQSAEWLPIAYACPAPPKGGRLMWPTEEALFRLS